jgi:hypothetical protein
MLNNHPPKPTTAFPGEHFVWVAAGVHCSHCKRELRATDVDVDRDGAVLRCNRCHQDILKIERRQ